MQTWVANWELGRLRRVKSVRLVPIKVSGSSRDALEVNGSANDRAVTGSYRALLDAT